MQGVEECGEWQESWEDFWVGPKGGRDVTFTFTKSKVLLPCQKRDLCWFSLQIQRAALRVSVLGPPVVLRFPVQFNGWTKQR